VEHGKFNISFSEQLVALLLCILFETPFAQYSLEGHHFAVFGFKLTSDLRYVVSVSNKFITWDLSTSDMTRDVNPGLEGLMQQLELSPDNRYAAAFTNNNQVRPKRTYLSGI